LEENPDLLADLVVQLDIDTLNASLGKVFDAIYVVAYANVPMQPIPLVMELPPKLAGIIGQKELALTATTSIPSLYIYMTDLGLEKSSVPTEDNK